MTWHMTDDDDEWPLVLRQRRFTMIIRSWPSGGLVAKYVFWTGVPISWLLTVFKRPFCIVSYRLLIVKVLCAIWRRLQHGDGPSGCLLQALQKLRETSLTALLSCAGAPSPGAQYSRRLSGCPSCPTPASTPTSSSSSTRTTGRRPTSPTTAASTERTEMKGEWGVVLWNDPSVKLYNHGEGPY